MQPLASAAFDFVDLSVSAVGHFTPGHAALGGLLLGIATCAMLLLNGRVLGISGAVKGIVTSQKGPGRVELLAGMLLASVPLGLLIPVAFQPLPEVTYSVWRMLLAGLLVGVGTSMGNGCTSGHGICGLSRLSLRSLVYTMTFMAVGAIAATLSGSAAAAGVAVDQAATMLLPSSSVVSQVFTIAGFATLVFVGLGMVGQRMSKGSLETVSTIAIGATFATGLTISGMTLPGKVASFLSPTLPAWDASLALVMASALSLSAIAYQAVMGRWSLLPASMQISCSIPSNNGSSAISAGSPLLAAQYSIPTSSAIDSRLMMGAVLFGAGWGLSGVCPGPAIVGLAGSAAAAMGSSGAVPLASSLSAQILPYLVGMISGFLIEPRATSALTPTPSKPL